MNINSLISIQQLKAGTNYVISFLFSFALFLYLSLQFPILSVYKLGPDLSILALPRQISP